jgi:RimJ/RimL family protein N-acetyltransferase
VTTTSSPAEASGNRDPETNGPTGDAVSAVPGSFTLIDREGCEVLLRPLVQADRPTVARLFSELSAQTRFRRFNSLYADLSDKQLTSLFDLDFRDRFAWAVEVTCDGTTTPVAVGRYARYTGSRRADVAITIRDEWQGRGLGGSLLDALIVSAYQHGFVAFETVVTADNHAMLHLLRRRGAEVSAAISGEVDVVLPLSGSVSRNAAHRLYRSRLPAAARTGRRVAG